MAEIICERLARQRSISVEADSAGIYAAQGSPMTHNASEAMRILFGEEARHFSKPLTRALIEESDLIVAMTDSHLMAIKESFPGAHAIRMPCEIPDPFGGDLDDYIRCAERLEEGLSELFDRGVIA